MVSLFLRGGYAGKRRAVLFGAACAALLAMLSSSAEGGTIEEQRARLPPPAECSDNVEGVWVSLRYEENWGEWYEYTLNVRRAQEGSNLLVGDIVSHYWYGRAGDTTPPPCRAGGFETIVKMPAATGKNEGQAIELGATRYETERDVCGVPHGYNPDHFSGTIDPDRQEFQSVNNDGGKAVNDPVVFRRVKCFDPPRKEPRKNVVPPAFAPLKRAASCGK